MAIDIAPVIAASAWLAAPVAAANREEDARAKFKTVSLAD
jgi:hypothetical protein